MEVAGKVVVITAPRWADATESARRNARATGHHYIGKHTYCRSRNGAGSFHPEEITAAICFTLANSAVSGELWTDAGRHAPA
jgi:hypothetical protein